MQRLTPPEPRVSLPIGPLKGDPFPRDDLLSPEQPKVIKGDIRGNRYEIVEGIAVVIKKIAAEMRELEKCRVALFQSPNFAISLLFQQMDLQKKGYLTLSDFYTFIRYYSFNISDGELEYLYSLFADPKSNRIAYEQFVKMLLPSSDKVLCRTVLNRKVIASLIDECLDTIAETFGTLLVREMDAQHHIDEVKIKFYSFFNYTIDHDFVYSVLDPLERGYISFDDIDQMMTNLSMDFIKEDYDFLIRYFNRHNDDRFILQRNFIDNFLIKRLAILRPRPPAPLGNTGRNAEKENPFKNISDEGLDEYLHRTNDNMLMKRVAQSNVHQQQSNVLYERPDNITNYIGPGQRGDEDEDEDVMNYLTYPYKSRK